MKKNDKLTEIQEATLLRSIPFNRPVEETRQWLIGKLSEIDEQRREIKDTLKRGNLPVDKARKAEKKSDYLFLCRKFYREHLVLTNQKIKDRNIKMHSLKPGEVQIFIEMVNILEEADPELRDELYDRAVANLEVKKHKNLQNA